MAYQAQQNFTASPDGIPVSVERGQVFPDNHPLVKLDAGRGLLFKPLDLDAPPPAGKAPRVAKPAAGKDD
jgi:hypothetical protein